MAEKEESRFGKYLELYFSRFQGGRHEVLEKDRGVYLFGPFKFGWAVLTALWQWKSRNRR
ncbi:MAG: hypothetical protein WC632_06345 [Candidatus Margulisiibacteriota bacterium]